MTLVHEALRYRDLDEFLAGTTAFVEDGLEAGEPVMVAVPGARVRALRGALNGSAEDVRFADMTQLGRNPGRIIPAVREWFDAHGGRRARFIGEPIWPGRSESEVVEATRHEALLNLAFADAPITILCPYDVGRLDPRVLAESEHTHPILVCDGERRESPAYVDPGVVYAAAGRPLPAPDAPVSALAITHDLARVRRLVAHHARPAGLDVRRTADLLVAVSEAATNTLLHAGGSGVLRVWHDPEEVVCEIADRGRITDPLVGRRRPDLHTANGRGLWLIHQLCDLVELRPRAAGTTLRLHMIRA